MRVFLSFYLFFSAVTDLKLYSVVRVIILMECITMCLDSTNKLEQWYVRHSNVYCLHPWATCFNLYTGHLQAHLYM